eukprot:UN23831
MEEHKEETLATLRFANRCTLLKGGNELKCNITKSRSMYERQIARLTRANKKLHEHLEVYFNQYETGLKVVRDIVTIWSDGVVDIDTIFKIIFDFTKLTLDDIFDKVAHMHKLKKLENMDT